MMHSAKVSFRPGLEELAGRTLPSFLLSVGVGPLVAPLNTVLSDMQSAIADVKVQHDTIVGLSNTSNLSAVQSAYSTGVADWQRALLDQHAIQAAVNADLVFLRAAAFAEASEGDVTDAILLTFGPLIGFNPTSTLSDTVNQANNLINNDATLQTDIHTTFSAQISFPGGNTLTINLPPFAQAGITTPPF